MKNLKVLAFTHKHVELKDLGNLVICNEELESRLMNLKHNLDIPEVFYIGTCNRVEFVFYGAHDLTNEFIAQFMEKLNFCVPQERLQCYLGQVNKYEGMDALNHLLRMSCSLESLVVGEKEILAQVRRAYERCKEAGFTGDFLRLLMDRLVKTAKEVYTHTKISRNPISVVSLAYRKLKEIKSVENPRILIIGSGETNQNLAKYFQKKQSSNFVIFNRTVENAEKLATELNAQAYPLSELINYKGGFDILITCTGATTAIIDNTLYQSLLNGEVDKKIIIDLAIPNDIDAEVLAKNAVHYIEVSSLQAIANKNIEDRYSELSNAEKIIADNIQEFLPIIKQRRVEVAMRQVPQKIKEIKSVALNEVFASEVQALDPEARDVLEKIINYMEKKYIKVPMVMAKEILVKVNENGVN
ncbi:MULTISPECIES: glutamyl-tRNA reductase [Sphingobacterium]|uniref:glutamyl-tRNA reductase n=1 Tax=Sphingobacterium TaxID=28453 RepID=UPI0004E5F2DD|nr:MULTISPECIES: glutamyl-tRNA reductase [Sphingobacterium]UPZ37198.1 glutamyl-tRNA reductase [Sphingobacterium sp. PCS056]WGQ16433.1 glutamyl-tRNA reductase [Sphingobacterium faecium]CDT06873.1 Glutamyl-tRNA reductase [Sphingobacterium sp. PM2-P1-29]HCU45206.1 glutamyl-tRNA reductase [Sphingobacterium sp.]